ncbi:hypothetical protein ACJMK2_027468 [Sinanodonta woodiana]|uniref:Ig-like domain-containing protein n=1 Tax=Sinanodonta woodiana TaxID=1069815 RepID=A0ABD3XR69_SINWO
MLTTLMTPKLSVNMEILVETRLIWIMVLFLSFGYTCGNSVSLTSSSGQKGQPLELKCQLTLSGVYNPFTVNWYLNDFSTAIERDASSCDPVTSPSVYDLSRYTFSCKTNIFTLTIKTLSQDDHGNCWKCRVLFTDTGPTATASTCISVSTTLSNTTSAAEMEPKQDNLALIIGVSIGGFTFLLLVIIIICCCCPGCCLYSCCRKEEKKKSKQIRCNQDVNNHTNDNHSGTPSTAYELSNDNFMPV